MGQEDWDTRVAPRYLRYGDQGDQEEVEQEIVRNLDHVRLSYRPTSSRLRPVLTTGVSYVGTRRTNQAEVCH